MRIVITENMLNLIQMSIDTKAIKEQILVVCLNGIRVTDEYECIVCPKKQEGPWLNSRTPFVESRQYKALLEVADELNVRLGRDDSVVFLSDNLRESLYPFYVIKDLNKFNRLHLCTMSPFLVEPKWRIKSHRELLSDLSKLTSVLYFNSHEYLNRDNTKAQKIMSAFDFYITCFPKVLLHVGDMTEVSYYDFEKDAYVPVEEGHILSEYIHYSDLTSDIPKIILTGLPTINISDEELERNSKKDVERQAVRNDGKRICSYLRELRIKLAEANGIDYHPAACANVELCSGTCAKCDEESAYLRDELNRIEPEKRVIPKDSLTEWEV